MDEACATTQGGMAAMIGGLETMLRASPPMKMSISPISMR